MTYEDARLSKRKQSKLYKQRHPENVKKHRILYLDRRFKKNPQWMSIIDNKIKQDFDRFSRLVMNDFLPNVCEICGDVNDLQIHHMSYIYPLNSEDLIRVCKKCHSLEHQKIKPFKKIHRLGESHILE